jgi:hypothetical protein
MTMFLKVQNFSINTYVSFVLMDKACISDQRKTKTKTLLLVLSKGRKNVAISISACIPS